jgi:hypothetical protein
MCHLFIAVCANFSSGLHTIIVNEPLNRLRMLYKDYHSHGAELMGSEEGWRRWRRMKETFKRALGLVILISCITFALFQLR